MKCGSREFITFHSARKSESRAESAVFPDKLIDYLSGSILPFSNRDNIRQKLVRMLIEEKGYGKEDLSLDREIRFDIGGQQACSRVDISIGFDNKTLMVMKCAAGSVVSRERQVIATARLLEDYVIPLAVVTNGVDMELLDTLSERVIGDGIAALPSRRKLYEFSRDLTLKPANKKKLMYEQNILYTYDSISCSLHCKSDPHPG
jgi:hypothetical protein